jgi:hypothetical protein
MTRLPSTVGADVTTWTFGGLTRGEDGKFDDAAMAKILVEA